MNTFTNKYKIIATIKLHTDQTQILGICGSVKNIPEANSKFELFYKTSVIIYHSHTFS